VEHAGKLHDQLSDVERQLLRRAAAIAIALCSAATPANAVYQQGGLELASRLSVQNTFQHEGADSIDWVQERNELRFDVKYDFLGAGRTELGLRQAVFNMRWRGRYDSVFDARGSYGARGYRRDDFRFPEGKTPRELFVDLRFDGPLHALSARIGRQQVVWGEADVFRSLDVVNPLRLDQNGILGEEFEDYREPLWIAKFLYDLGELGPIANAGLEFLYSPNGRPLTDRLVFGEEFRIKFDNPLVRPNRRPTQLPFSRVRYPWELSRDGPHKTEVFDQADLGSLGGVIGNVDLIYLNDNRMPTETLSYEASVAGVRFLGKTFAGIDFTLNYLFKRSDLPGTKIMFQDLFDPRIATNGSPNPRLDKLAAAITAAATPDANGNGFPDGTEALINRCLVDNEPVYIFGSLRNNPGNNLTACLRKPFVYPWTHIIGGTLTYNDDITGAVFRAEESFSTREPGNGVRPAAPPRSGQFPTARDFATRLARERQVWRSMVGFDYLRAFPFLPVTRHDPWLLTFQFLNEYDSHARGQVGATSSITDRIQHWNPLFTFLATGYFLNSRLRPIVAAAYEVDTAFPVFWLQGEYFLTDRWTVRAGEVLYAGSRYAENFLFLNKYADRDTLYLQLSYKLL
jgi:uncharacterized protein DUF1302